MIREMINFRIEVFKLIFISCYDKGLIAKGIVPNGNAKEWIEHALNAQAYVRAASYDEYDFSNYLAIMPTFDWLMTTLRLCGVCYEDVKGDGNVAP